MKYPSITILLILIAQKDTRVIYIHFFPVPLEIARFVFKKKIRGRLCVRLNGIRARKTSHIIEIHKRFTSARKKVSRVEWVMRETISFRNSGLQLCPSITSKMLTELRHRS